MLSSSVGYSTSLNSTPWPMHQVGTTERIACLFASFQELADTLSEGSLVIPPRVTVIVRDPQFRARLENFVFYPSRTPLSLLDQAAVHLGKVVSFSCNADVRFGREEMHLESLEEMRLSLEEGPLFTTFEELYESMLKMRSPSVTIPPRQPLFFSGVQKKQVGFLQQKGALLEEGFRTFLAAVSPAGSRWVLSFEGELTLCFKRIGQRGRPEVPGIEFTAEKGMTFFLIPSIKNNLHFGLRQSPGLERS